MNEENKKYCLKCGTQILSIAVFCSNCGTPQVLPAETVASLQEPPPIPQITEWFYSEDGKKIGPVSEENIIQLIESGTLITDTNIWCKGMNEWMTLGKSPLAKHLGNNEPPPLPKKLVSDGYIWALALAPIWGAVLQAAIAGFILGSSLHIPIDSPNWNEAFSQQMGKLWWIVLACNVGMGILDERKLEAAGYNNVKKKLSIWLAVLVPIYIFKRDKLLDAGMTRFWVWLGSFIVSILYI